MTINGSISAALSAIRSTQQQFGITSANIANQKTAGYSRQSAASSALVANNGAVYGVRSGAAERDIDLLVQKQWRVANSGSAYADIRSTVLSALDHYWGAPNSSGSLNALFSGFTGALQKLATTPHDKPAQGTAVAAAQSLANRLGQLSGNIQSLRQETEIKLSDAANHMNTLLSTVAGIDRQIVSVGASGGSTAALKDKLDAAIDELSSYVDLKVGTKANGGMTLSLSDGTQLYDDTPVTFSFDQQGQVDASHSYSSDDSQRSLGTLKIATVGGADTDLFKTGAIRSGKIAAWKELRDKALVEAQTQLDMIAATLSKTTSTRSVNGTAVSDATAKTAGFSLGLSGLTEGNKLTVDYVDSSANPPKTQSVVFIAYDSTKGKAPDGSFTAAPDDTVVGLDLSGSKDFATQIADKLNGLTGGSTVFSGTYAAASHKLEISVSTNSAFRLSQLTGEISSSSDSDGNPAFSLFVDSATGKPYTGLANGQETLNGLAGRLIVSPKVVADPSLMVRYDTATQSGDGARPQGLLDALNDRLQSYSSAMGIGSSEAPFSGSFKNLLSQVTNARGSQTEDTKRVAEGQSIVSSNLKTRYDDSRAVNLDSELATLLQLQTAYSANARVLSSAQAMIDTLLHAFR